MLPSWHLEGEWVMEMQSKCQLRRPVLCSHHRRETTEPLIGFSPHQLQTHFKNNSRRHKDGSAHLSAQKPVSFNNNCIEIFVQL